ncbi:nucleotidyltransferase [Flavobacterium sp. ZT3R18]|uniref:nucleotidyltransferase family protein n=1 Tax=Flavobacterium sp. ZT3R18 TaxID=2594429 RepID=UPI00117B598B|nr:sugar phosphate nucleotidyltransferase [Flavobacterium sp. ZT3R18]TRX32026.1 nucleotidyltransferase [Flavobacterium sp. ZT3R18]
MKPTLVVLAAGLGTRYGGLKQLDTIGPNGEIIMDYSISDAILAGFGKIVLIVQEDMIPILTERYIRNQKVAVEFVVQTKELTLNVLTYKNVRPWGTAHAVWCAKDKVKNNFLLINADDFYGRSSFQLAYDHLSTFHNPCAIVYPILKTLSENGTVNRAEIQMENNYLVDSIEREKIRIENGVVLYPDANSELQEISKDAFVSMNMFGFTTQIFDFIDTDIHKFIAKWLDDNSIEYQLPNVVGEMIKNNIVTVEVLKTNEEWIGITYKTDKELAEVRLQKLHDQGIYKNEVWKN